MDTVTVRAAIVDVLREREAQKIWRHYLPGEPMQLLFAEQEHVKASVHWAGKAWEVTLRPGEEGDWRFYLLHELAHVKLSHLARRVPRKSAEATFNPDNWSERERARIVEQEELANAFATLERPRWR